MKIFTFSLIIALILGLMPSVGAQELDKPSELSRDRIKAMDRASAAAGLFHEVMDLPRGMPQYILNEAEVIAVFPSRKRLKSPYSHKDGAGVISVRDQHTGEWGPPLFITLDGGKFEDLHNEDEKDLILVGMNLGIAASIMDYKFRLGRQVGVSAGPFGDKSEFETDWSSFDGFVGYVHDSERVTGMAVTGAKIKHDKDLNESIYGSEKVNTFRPVANLVPSDVLVFSEALNQYSRRIGV
jgi:lipid-binding SYLF domain-containing protein